MKKILQISAAIFAVLTVISFISGSKLNLKLKKPEIVSTELTEMEESLWDLDFETRVKIRVMLMNFKQRTARDGFPGIKEMVLPLCMGNYNFYISSGYGKRIHPVLKRKEFHRGIDLPAPRGTGVVNISEG
ncbi:MAG: M23 family metallopeptidase, partial [Candidatus Heimdallarchaeaceae archaeon]